MSKITIKFSELEDAKDKAQKVQNEISGYVSQIKKHITTRISDLPGSDSSGYASTASTLAWQKISQLNEKSERFSSFQGTITGFIATARSVDTKVSNKIKSLADTVLEPRKWYQVPGDFLYDLFCVDLANSNDLTKLIANIDKTANTYKEEFWDQAKDWFKHGDGKYALNIAGAILAAIGAVAGVIIAIVTLPVTGIAAVIIGAIALIASGISMAITLVNSQETILANLKALRLSKEGYDGAARYYGNIDSLSEKWNRTDMGDQSDNEFYEGLGRVIDTTKVVADITTVVCSIAKLGNVVDYRYKNPSINGNKGYDFSWNNIKKNILQGMEYRTSADYLDTRKAFNFSDSFFATDYIKKFTLDGNLVVPKGMFNVFWTAKIISNVQDVTAVISGESIEDRIKGFLGVLGNMDFFSFLDYFKDPYFDIAEPVVVDPISGVVEGATKMPECDYTEPEFYYPNIGIVGARANVCFGSGGGGGWRGI